MSEITTPSNPNIPLQTSIPGNVASLTNPSTLSNLKNSVSPKTFGDQVKNIATQKVIKVVTESTIAQLYKEKADLIQEEIKLDINYQLTLQKLEQQTIPSKKVVNGQTVDIPPKLTQEEYQIALIIEKGTKKYLEEGGIPPGTLNGQPIEGNYPTAKKNILERKDLNQKNIDNYLNDPFKKQKDQAKKIKNRLKKRKNKNKADKTKSKKELNKAVLQNAKKSIVPILTLLLTNKIADIISQNDKIGKLVNDTNTIIIEANESGDPTKLNNAKLARDNAIRIIQNNLDKITQINNQIQRIQTYINIFNIIVNIIGPVVLSIPTSIPDLVTPSKETFRRKIYEPTVKLLDGLSALLPIILTSLQRAIDILQEYRLQLLNINGELETATSENPSLIDNPNKFGTDFGTYKGFKFALKEESGPRAIVVAGNKRHYAEAIDRNNVAVLKSELSFTLDPNDLIDQLKLIIDRENLIA